MGTLQTLTTRRDSPKKCRDSNDGLIVPEAVYWKRYYNDPDITYEWKNGKLEKRAMSDPLNYFMYKWLVKCLDEFLETHPVAQTIGLEIGFRLALPNETVIRRPDLGVVLDDNPVPLEPDDKTYHGIFDICIESVSDSNDEQIERDTIFKKQEYATGGVTEYLILDAKNEYTAYYRLNAQGVYVPVKPTKEGIMKSKVLPGFQFRFEDLYTQPTLKEMSEDPVYQGFVLPFYQKEKKTRQKVEEQVRKAQAQALEEKKARQQEKKARQKAERQAQKAEAQAQKAEMQIAEEKKARQVAEAEIARLQALLANKGD